MGGIGLLGPLRVDGGETLEPRDRITLSVLAVRRGNVVSQEEFAEALWADRPPSSWPKQVQICIGRLRKVLGPAAIETVPGGYRLALNGDEVDGYQFEQLIDRARVLRATGQVDRAAASYARALSLWRGRPLDELDGWLPGQSEAARLEELRRTAEEDWLDCRLAAGEHREVAAEAQGLVTAEPLRERRWAILALAQYRCGRQGDALRSLTRARRVLVDELGIDPGPDLVSLEEAILRQDPTLSAVPEAAAASEACPYKGLASYDVGDEETFFGRDAEIAACLERLGSTPLLVVAGPSGCGKSSLVRAGLVPALRRRELSAVVFVPGTDPDGSMDTAIAGVEGPAILVIDQFEELLALGHRPEVIRGFCRRIAAHASEVAAVIMAVRSDHLGGLGTEPGFSRLAERGLHLVTPLAGDALRESIEQPAELAGLRLEHGLVELLVRDCEGEPGGLPLLSHALAETWRRRDGNVLTVEGYRATGGIRGAVARSADRLYDTLPSDQRAVLRSVLLRLVTPSLDGDPVRCRVSSRSLLGDADRERIVGLLVRARLVTSEKETFELAHEALARAWPRLQSWLDDDVAGQRLLRHLTTAAEGWESLGRPVSELYRGARLDTALEWQEASAPHLTDLEQQFLADSVDQASSETRATAERARRDAHQNRRLRSLLGATALLLVVSMIVGYVAIRQREQATSERQVASRERQVATARELAAAANANLDVDPELSINLALAALDQSRAGPGSVLPEAEQALHDAVTASRAALRVPGVGGAVEWSPDGTRVAAASQEGTVDILDARTGEPRQSIAGHDARVNGIAFSPDGTMVATTGEDGFARIWDLETGEVLHALESPAGRDAIAPSFSADGSLFAAAWLNEGLVRILDVSTGRIVQEILVAGSPRSTSFDPTGARIVIGMVQMGPSVVPAVVVDVRSGDEVLTLAVPFTADAAWSPDGASIATAGRDGSARIFDARTGTERFALLRHRDRLTDLDWSADSSRIVTASADGTATVWLVIEGGGRELFTLSAQETRGGIASVGFSPDGLRVVTGDVENRATIVWDASIAGDAELANLVGVALVDNTIAAFTPDGRHLLVGNATGGVTVWDAQTLTRLRTLATPASSSSESSSDIINTPEGPDVTALDVSPDGQLVAAAITDYNQTPTSSFLRTWDVETGQEAFRTRPRGFVDDVAWSPDGNLLAISTSNLTDEADGNGGQVVQGSLAVVDRSGDEIAFLPDEEPFVQILSIAFTPDGERIIGSRSPMLTFAPLFGQAATWNWEDGQLERSIDTGGDEAVLSPRGDLIVSTPRTLDTGSQVAEVWDWATGEHLRTLAGHSGSVTRAAFTPDGSRVATTSSDGTVRLWDPYTGEQQLVLRGHTGRVSSVTFSHDGSRLASVSADGTVRVWALDLDELIEIAQDGLTRGFTEEECRQYLHTEHCPQT